MGSTAEKIEKRFTYAEYCKWDDEQRWELIEGIPYNMTPAPATKHQSILTKLVSRIDAFLAGKTCKPFIAPTDVVFDDYNVVQPDLLVVCDRSKITDANIKGTPDLVVEILSPSTSRKDRREKKALYERFGVREYLVIDPANETVERLRLVKGKYGNPDVFGWDESMKLVVLPELELNLWEIFEKERIEAVNEPRPGYTAKNRKS
jgi:Uma2 family endonuclease